LGGTTLLGVALFIANCGQDQVVGPDGPTRLVFSVGPSTATAGASIAPAVRVEARDAENNLTTGFTGAVTLSLGTNPSGGTLSGTLTVNAAGGVATFDDLSINRSGVGYTLSASASQLTAATSEAFDIDPGPATRLAYSVEPTTATAGAAIAPAMEIEARDAFDNVDVNFTGDVSVAITSGTGAAGATLSGTVTVAASAGVAAFDDLSIDRTGTGYTLDAASGSLTSATSASFDIDPGAAAQLVFGVEPSNAVAGASIAPAVQVIAQDAQGNTATGFTGDVTVAIGTNPGGGTLSGTATATAVAGVATFNNLSIDMVGSGYTLAASSTGLAGATSAAFAISTGQVAQLVFTVPPSNATAGQPIAPAVEVTAQDPFGNTVSSFVDNVTVAIAGGAPAPAAAPPGAPGASLSGTLTVAAVAGVATFSDLSIDLADIAYSLEATSGAITSAPSPAFAVDPGAATQIFFSVQPSGAISGAAFSVEVTARDGFGNTATSFTGDVTMAIGNNAGSPPGTLSGTLTQSAVGGVATFPDLSIDMVGTGYTLAATSGTLTGATSAAFDISAGGATQLVLTQQPSTTVAGQPITPAIEVTAQDASGNTVTSFSDNVTMTIGTNPGSGVLSGTTVVAPVNGVATFSDLSIGEAGTGYQLQAASATLTSPLSSAFDITPGSAAELSFTVQPSSAQAGVPIAPSVVVTARDALGNTATSFASDVSMTITAGTGTAGAVLSGTTTRTAAAGVVTFDDLSIDKDGTGYTLSADAAGLTGATSGSFDISVGSATQLVFTQDPTTATAGDLITPAVEVTALDGAGNVATGFTGNVTVAITAGTGTAGAALSGTVTAAAVAGVVTFNDLSIDLAGSSYTLTATSGTLTDGTSAAFDINAGQATQLVFTGQPTDQTAGQPIAVVVTARDAFGNTDVTFTGNVTAAITSGTGTAGAVLSGTQTQAATAGVATFNDLSIDLSGTGYTLDATATGLPMATSGSFAINPDAATQLVFTAQPTNAVAATAISPAVQVTARDPFGNTATGFTGDVAMAITAGTGTAGAALSGTATVAAVAGIATFADLSIDLAGTGYTLTASSGTLTDGTSAAFDIAEGSFSQLAFTVQPPASTEAAVTFGVEVTAQDAQGNTVTSFTGNVDLTLGANPPGGTLNGTLTAAAVAGVATFSDLSIVKAGDGYQLQAAAGAIVSPLSTAFSITPAAASQLAFTAQPTSQTAGVAISPAVGVTALDPFGNTDVSFTGDVTVAIGANPSSGALSGTLTLTASAGITTYSDLSIDKSGIGYTLTASSGALAQGSSAAFDITAAAASKLVFTADPVTTTAGVAIPAIEVTALDAFDNVDLSFAGDIDLAIDNNPGAGTLSGTLTLTASGGISTFSDISIDKIGPGYTLAATSGTLTAATSAAFDITAAAASKLAFTVEPSNATAGNGTVGGVIAPSVVVSALDPFDNVVPSYAGDVTLAISDGTGTAGANLFGTTTQTAASGVATFNDLSIDLASPLPAGTNPYTLSATSGTLTGATSAGFEINADAATQLAFTVQPATSSAGNGTLGGTIAPTVEVSAQDPLGNTDPAFAGVVTLAIVDDPSSGTAVLFGGSATAANGAATYGTLAIDITGTGYTLQATAGALTSPVSTAFDIIAGPAASIVFTGQPTDATTNANIQPDVRVTAFDVLSNVATGFGGNVTMAITPGSGTPGANLGGSLTRAAVNGVATFSTLDIDLPSPLPAGTNPYTLTATTSGLAPVVSAPFEIIASVPTQLFFEVQPSASTAGNGVVGGTIPAFQVVARDASGQNVTSFTGDVSVAIITNPSGGTLFGTTTVTVTLLDNGIATFSGLSIDRAGVGYKLEASSVGLPSTTSAFFNIDAGVAHHLAFTVQPSPAAQLATITPQVEVTVQDVLDNTVTSFTGLGNDVTLSITALTGTPGALLSGVPSVTATADKGVAAFPTLNIDLASPTPAGTNPYTLDASVTGLPVATSNSFEITSGAPSQLVITQQPSSAIAGVAIAPAVEVTVVDGSGTPIPSFPDPVTLTITAGTGTSGATLFGTTSVTPDAVTGVATFPGINIDREGFGYTLSATAPNVGGAESNSFSITHSTADHLDFTVQPATTAAGAAITPAVQVTVEDAFGNPVEDFSGDVTVSIADSPNGGTLSGTLTLTLSPVDLGVAVFSDLSIDVSGSGYRLDATSLGLTSDISNAFTITAGAADHLVFTVSPSDASAGALIKPNVRVAVHDALGNVVTGYIGNITVAITSGTGTPGALLGGTTTQAAASGVAVFSDLNIDLAGNDYTLQATDTGLTPVESATFDIFP
jgi:hypothetical protein